MVGHAGARPPMPAPTPLTQPFWDGAADRCLIITRCNDCGFWIHPPRPICRRCLSWDVGPDEVSGRGTLYAYTVTPIPFHPYWADKVPYVVAVVELVEQPGLRLITCIDGCDEDDLHVGMPVQVTYVDAAPGLTLPMFRRVDE